MLPLRGTNLVLLDMANKRFVTNSVHELNSRVFHEWIRLNYADLSSGVVEPLLPIVSAFDTMVASATSNGWDSVTPVEAQFNWSLMTDEPPFETRLQPQKDRTDTFYFRTRENLFGVLQILGVSENPEGVKIRYKLVQTATNQ